MTSLFSVVRWTFEDYWRSQVQSVTYEYAGGPQQFIVPDSVTRIRVTLRGGNGGGNEETQVKGSGGYVEGWLDVDPGETLYIYVGGNGGAPRGINGGSGGWNGGGDGGNANNTNPNYPDVVLLGGYGGGGATDIRQGGSTLRDRVAVAAGSGGTSGFGHPEGVAGARVGHTGYEFDGTNFGGKGGTQNAGGNHGIGDGDLSSEAVVDGTDGDFGVGGNGSDNPHTHGHSGAGGGGAGWYGGGGGGIGYLPSSGTHKDDVRLANDIATHLIYAFGGGGGSNYVDGLMQNKPMKNEDGVKLNHVSYNPHPHVTIHYQQDPVSWEMDINPDDGGTPSVTKNMLMSQTVGPNRVNIVQEGRSTAPVMTFSGVILTQEHLEAMEEWFDRRTFIKVTDDLGREFYGVFSAWTPHRQRRARNYWYHTYDAQFTLAAYKNSSGSWLYGRVS